MDLSVIICTHNRATLLDSMLETLGRADYPPDVAMEILIIANACGDSTLEVARRHAELFHQRHQPDVRILEEPTPGKSVALNLALRESRGEALCFIDDDQFIAKDFFTVLLATLSERTQFEIVCGYMWPDWDGSEPAWVHVQGAYHIGIRPFPEYDLGPEPMEIRAGMKLPSGGNITVRRPVFARAGEFARDLGPQGHNLMGGEDIEFIRRALATGARIFYQPAIRQKHAVEAERMATSYMMRKSYQRSRSNVMMDAGVSPGFRFYMLRKIMRHAWSALFAGNANKRFFYLLRLAAAYGELRGAMEKSNGASPM